MTTDDQGRVRPADGRYRDGGQSDPDELARIREQEIEDGLAALREKHAAEDAANQKRLDDAGYENTTTPEYQAKMRAEARAGWAKAGEQDGGTPEAPLSEMVTNPEADGAEIVDTTGGDQYDAMAYAELQQAAKARDLNAGGTADELKARLREADAGN